MNKEDILNLFKEGNSITEESFAALINFFDSKEGPKGPRGTKGKDGASITSIELTKNKDGEIDGGTATLSDSSVVPITIK